MSLNWLRSPLFNLKWENPDGLLKLKQVCIIYTYEIFVVLVSYILIETKPLWFEIGLFDFSVIPNFRTCTIQPVTKILFLWQSL